LIATESGLSEVDLEGLCAQVAPKAGAMFSRAGVPADAAEDLLQDCLVRLIEVKYEIRDPRAWLLSAIRYAILMYWRAERGRLVEQLRPSLEATLRTPTEVDQAAIRIDLLRALRKLSPQQRELIDLRYVQGLEPRDIARLKNCSTANIRKHAARSFRILRDNLSPSRLKPGRKA
jgi:RNA polymerase sigma factor (sigma-70 family)